MKCLVFFLFILLQTSYVWAEEAPENLARFSIDKKIYDNFSDAQRNDLLKKNQELMEFIENDIKKTIPLNVQDKLRNLRIKIPLTEIPGRDGLFVPSENGEHTIFIQMMQLSSNGIRALLAHEIYHAIHYHLNPNEDPWIREGMAQLFEYMTTQELNGMNLRAAIENPLTPLLGQYDVKHAHPAQYGHDMLYFFYLYHQCGGKDFFWKLTEGDSDTKMKGTRLIDQVLGQMNYPTIQCQSFSTSALHFEVAKIHNKTQFSQASEQQTYYLFPGNIQPIFPKVASREELEKILEKLPPLSSFHLPLKDYLKFQWEWSEGQVFYLQENFPYEVLRARPSKTEGISVVLVKTLPRQ